MAQRTQTVRKTTVRRESVDKRHLPPIAHFASQLCAVRLKSTHSGRSRLVSLRVIVRRVRGVITETRKIAAILAADVVGFSRMTSADEDRTLARLRTLRSELIDPAVASQNGRVFKRTGDGALVEFRSVVEAVRFAITVQNAMIERNAGMPADQRIDFRIGIHLGDVVEESDGDLMGDGVNMPHGWRASPTRVLFVCPKTPFGR